LVRAKDKIGIGYPGMVIGGAAIRKYSGV